MSIELHCPQCQKLIRAPDTAGGHRGKCPYCSNSVYIPMPTSDEDVIPLAALDQDEERRAEEERRRAIRYAAMVDHATEGSAPAAEAEPTYDDSPGEVVDLHAEVESFVLAMRDSKLDIAEAAVGRMRRIGTRARDFVEGLIVDEMPPDYENVPPPVVKGFLKKLLGQLER